MKKEIFQQYVADITTTFGLTQEELFSKNRSRQIVDARWMLYYVCIENPMPKPFLQQYMKNSGLNVSHTNILYGYRKAKELINEDYDYKAIVDNILNKYI